MISKNIINIILNKTILQDIIQEFVKLRKVGENYRGLSPFSNEKTPSFIISPKKQLWKDFSSGKGGNVITFLMEHEKLNYIEAVKWLANKYGIILKTNKKNNIKNNTNEIIFSVQETAKNFFINNLINKNDNIALEYLKKRKFTKKIIKKFEIGYAVNQWNALIIEIKNKINIDKEKLISSGLVIIKNNILYDRFRNRIIFPIHSLTGRILGFGARILNNEKYEKEPKYLNSPQNVIFNKSSILYGIKQAKKYIIKQDYCYLVEGYTDVLSLYQIGIKNTVSSLGTSITDSQINIIKRFTNKINIIFDGDEAGIQATIRSIKLSIINNIDLNIICLPLNEDPDSISKKFNKINLLFFFKKNTYDVIDFFFEKIINKLKNEKEKSLFINKLLKIINNISNYITRELFIKKISFITKIDEKSIKMQIYKLKSIHKSQKTLLLNNNNNKNTLIIIEEQLLQLILIYGDKMIKHKNKIISIAIFIIQQIINFNIEFIHKKHIIIFNIIKKGYLKKQIRTISFFNKIILDEYKIHNTITDIVFKKSYLLINKETINHKITQYVIEIILRYKLYVINDKINHWKLQLKNNTPTNKSKIKDKIIKLIYEKIQISKKLNRKV